MRSASMDVNDLVLLVDMVDYPVLECQPERIEPREVADELFAALRVGEYLVDDHLPQLFL